jgi:hypothetical protein
LAQVLTRKIKLVKKEFVIVSESFSLEGQSPYVRGIRKGDIQIDLLPKK